MLHCSPEERPLDAPQGRRVQDDDAEHDEALKLNVKFNSVFWPKKRFNDSVLKSAGIL